MYGLLTPVTLLFFCARGKDFCVAWELSLARGRLKHFAEVDEEAAGAMGAPSIIYAEIGP